MRAAMLLIGSMTILGLASCGKAAASVDAPSAPSPAAEAVAASPAPTSATPAAPTAQSARYTPVPIDAEDQPGRARRIRCRVGQGPEVGCTFTPLFGDGSFQLDGPDIAVRMVISDGEGSLFEVFGPQKRVPVGGVYVRNPRDRACWLTTDDGPSPVCAR